MNSAPEANDQRGAAHERTRPRLWLSMPYLPVKHAQSAARAAEAAGFDGLTVPDHAAVPEQVNSVYPYMPGKEKEFGPASEFSDPFITITAMALATKQLRFATNILIAPLRHPILLAKSIGTVAAIIGDRLDVGLGAGWMREEFDALGVDFSTRGSRLNETIVALRQLLAGGGEYHGELISFDPIRVAPIPEPDTVKLLVGGHSGVALRRAVSLADGWVGVEGDRLSLRETLTRIGRLREDAGVLPRDFEIRAGIGGKLTTADLVELTDLGVAGIMVGADSLRHKVGRLAAIAQFGQQIITPWRSRYRT
jgi:probable F420-dependent oxidoreductase